MSAPRLAALAAVAVLAVVANTARAAPPGQTAPFPAVRVTPEVAPVAAAEPAYDGYRLPLALVDLTAAGMIGLGVALDNDTATGAGVVAVFFAAPITHAVFDNVGNGGLSFALRGGLPVLGILGGFGVGTLLEGADDSGDMVLGGMIAGGVAALAIDYGYLARRPARARERPARTLAVMPTDSGAVVGLGGRF